MGINKNPTDFWSLTFNIAVGCQQISPGCAYCYAKEATEIGKCKGKYPDAWHGQRYTLREAYWHEPLKWSTSWQQEQGIKGIHFNHITCCSWSDVFENHSVLDAERKKLWCLIKQTPWLTWSLITKRHENIIPNLPWGPNDVPWPNVWIGVSVENDYWANKRLPYLTKVNSVVRFAICEPLLRPLPSLSKYLPYMDWVMVGGESSALHPEKIRPMQPEWIDAIINDCESAKVPFYFKQWGSKRPYQHKNADGSVSVVFKAGSRHAVNDNRKFHGHTWDALPVPKLGVVREAAAI